MTTLEIMNEILVMVNESIPELNFEYINGDAINILNPEQKTYSIPAILELFQYVLDKGHSEKASIGACAAKIIVDLKGDI